MQFAKMVDAGNPIDQLVQIKCSGNRWKYCDLAYQWDLECEYRVARAFIEGRPVFAGDKLWNSQINLFVTICDFPAPILDVTGFSWDKPGEKFYNTKIENCPHCQKKIHVNMGEFKPEEKKQTTYFDDCSNRTLDSACFSGCVWVHICPYAHKAKEKKLSFDEAMKILDKDGCAFVGSRFFSNDAEYQSISVRHDFVSNTQEITIARKFKHD
jgi:hypothetical protein